MVEIPSKEEHNSQDAEPQNCGARLLESVQNLNGLESLATKRLSKSAWLFNYAAAGDLISKRLDQEVYNSILLRPRILIDVKDCDISTSIIGQSVGLPVFVSPMAVARLAHPSGEAGISAACGRFGAMHVISHNASMTPEEIVAGAAPGQVFGFQIYVRMDRADTEAVLARINKLSAIKCVVLTVDEATIPKHELGPEGFKPYDDMQTGGSSHPEERSSSTADVKAALPSVSGTASDAEWETTLQWLANNTSLPILIKGIQTHEDAEIAAAFAPRVKGIILSNHGARVLDTAPPAIHTLLEIQKYCPNILGRLEVMVDGGIRRGTDVVKALCLGARAVGIGRAAFWGLGAGGVAGVERTFQILAEEIRSCMQLLGVRRVADLRPHHVNARRVEQQIYERH